MAPSLTKSTLLGLLAMCSLVVASPAPGGNVVARQTGTETGTCTSLNQRKSWSALTDDEKKAYIDAELCLMATAPKLGTVEGALNRWDELLYSHIVQSNIIHDTGAFLPWHRLYMRAHEVLLQTECGYAGAQPYWDELATIDAIHAGSAFVNASDVFDADTGLGGDGAGDDSCVADGPFVNLTLHITQTSTNASYCLSRSLRETGVEQGNQTNLDACMAAPDYAAAWLLFKSKPHNAGHSGIGGVMSNAVGSPGDPFFFLHHTYLDKVWWQWQQANLTSRLTDMNGRNVASDSFLTTNKLVAPGPELTDYFGDGGGNETTLNHTLWMVGLIPNATVGDVMDIGGDTICAEYIY